jgi:hypothetical protein
MMQIGETYHENLTIEKCEKILDDYKSKGEQISHYREERIKNHSDIKQ